MYYNHNTIVFLNGEFIPASQATLGLYTQSLHYGNGVFEGIRSYNTTDGAKIFKAAEHFERLHYSAKVMHLSLNYSVSELVEISYQLLKRNNLKDAYIRPLVFIEGNMGLTVTGESTLFIAAWEWEKYLGDKLLNVGTSTFRRPNPEAFHINAKVNGHYVNSILATMEAKGKNYDEALLLDGKGFIAEGPGANFFYEKNGKLITPPLGNILPGITRKTVIELANNFGVEVEEKHSTVSDVYFADGAFFTGTASEIAGIGTLDGKKFNLPFEETIGARLAGAYRDLVTSATEFSDWSYLQPLH